MSGGQPLARTAALGPCALGSPCARAGQQPRAASGHGPAGAKASLARAVQPKDMASGGLQIPGLTILLPPPDLAVRHAILLNADSRKLPQVDPWDWKRSISAAKTGTSSRWPRASRSHASLQTCSASASRTCSEQGEIRELHNLDLDFDCPASANSIEFSPCSSWTCVSAKVARSTPASP